MAILAFAVSIPVKAKKLRPITLLILLSVFSDLFFAIPYYLFDLFIPNTGKFYRLAEWIILLEFFKILLDFKWHKVYFRISYILVGVVFLIAFPIAVLRITNCLVFSLLSIFFLFTMIKELKYEKAVDSPYFWIVSAILVYFSGTIFLFLLIEPLGQLDEVSATITYMFHNALSVGKNLFFVVGFKTANKHLTQSL